MPSKPSVTDISGNSGCGGPSSLGTITKASESMYSPSGSRCSANSSTSLESIDLIVAPSPGGGQEPEMITRPPTIPLPGSLPVFPRMTTVPPLMAAPVADPAWPLTMTNPSFISAPVSLPAEPWTIISPPAIFWPTRSPASFSIVILPDFWKAPNIELQPP